MTDVLNFQTTPTGNDTGEADPEAIAPIKNGEPADQATLARPDEVLRSRTEVLRAEANANKWARDADRGLAMFLSSGGSIAWNGPFGGFDGRLVLSAGASLLIAPMTSPGQSRGDANEGAGTRFPTRFGTASFDNGGLGAWSAQADKFEFEGGFAITITVTDDPGSGDPPTVEVLGDGSVTNPAVQPGQRRIQVTYDSGEGHTVQDVVDAINGDVVSGGLVTATATGGADPAYDIAETQLSGSADGVFHEITDAELANFFASGSGAPLRSGDTLAIWYDEVQQRRESVEENSNKHLVPSASLVNLTTEPDKADNAVIIGRVVGDDFIFANGAVLPATNSTTVIAGGPATTITVDDSSWVVISGATVQDAFDSTDNEIDTLRSDIEGGNAAPPAPGAGTAGSEYVGIDNGGTFHTIQAGSDSVQEALTDLDTEFSLIQATIAPSGTGTQRIFSLADDYPELNSISETLGDTLRDTLEAFYNRVRTYTSLQDVFEASPVQRDGLLSNAEPYPLFVHHEADFAGASAGVVTDTGNWSSDVSNSEGWSALSADGRYVIIPGEPGVGTVTGWTDKVTIYNQRDMSVHATITLSATPVSTGITMLASDGFSLAVAYDSKIEMWDISGPTPTLDTGWATSGVFTHSGTANDQIRDMVIQNGYLYYVGDESDGAGDLGAGIAFAVIGTLNGTVIATESGNLNGNGIYIDVWGEKIAIYTDSGFNSLAVGVLNAGTIDADYIGDYDAWTSVDDIAINAKAVAIAGRNGTTDPRVEFRYFNHQWPMYDDDLGGDSYDRISLARTKYDFFACVTDQATTTAFVRGYTLHGTTIFETDVVKQPTRKFQFDLSIAGSQFWWEMQTDGMYLYFVRLDIGAGANERLYRYEMGRGSGHWLVPQRGFTVNEWRPESIVQLNDSSAYASI